MATQRLSTLAAQCTPATCTTTLWISHQPLALPVTTPAPAPGLKRHSVTLFEGGRVAGDAVMAELMAELWQSYEQGQVR